MKHAKRFIAENKAYALICVLIWTLAIVLGTYKAHTLSSADFPEISQYTGNPHFTGILGKLTKMHFKYTLAFLVCTSFTIGLPLSVFLIGFKGYSAGFVAAGLAKAYGIKGSAMSFFALVIPYSMTMPVIFMMYMLGLKYQIIQIKTRINHPHIQKKNEWLSYVAAVLILFVCLCLISCIEAFFVPRLMKLI